MINHNDGLLDAEDQELLEQIQHLHSLTMGLNLKSWAAAETVAAERHVMRGQLLQLIERLLGRAQNLLRQRDVLSTQVAQQALEYAAMEKEMKHWRHQAVFRSACVSDDLRQANDELQRGNAELHRDNAELRAALGRIRERLSKHAAIEINQIVNDALDTAE